MKDIKRNLCLLTAFIVMLGFSGVVSAERIKFSTPTPPPHIFTKSANKFANELTAQSNFKTKVHPLNKLGNVPAVISLLQSGALEFAIVPAGDLARHEVSFYAWFLPYTFSGVAAAGAAANTRSAQTMLERLDKLGMIGLGYIFPGQRHVLSKTAISSTSDLANKKVRAFPNEIFEMWWKQAGAAPTALPLPEIAPSLTTGVLDAVDVDLDIVVGLKFYKQAPHLALTNHMAFPGVALASKKWWDGLSANDQKTIRQLFASTQKWAIGEQVKAEANNLDKLRAEGVSISEIDSADFRKAAVVVRDAFLKRDSLIQEFYNEVK